MICLVLKKPDGAGGYTPAYAFTTDDQSTSLPLYPITAAPGWIVDGSISEISSQIDISQAQGNVAQGEAWSFALVDHDGTERRSVGILDGSERFVGWIVDAWVSRDGYPYLIGADLYVITDVSADGEAVQFQVSARWALDGSFVGLGSDDKRVGIVVGGHEVTVQTPEIGEPQKITYRELVVGLLTGSPSFPQTIGVPSTTATRRVDPPYYYYSFELQTADEADDLYELLNEIYSRGELIVVGENYSTVCTGLVNSRYRNGIYVYVDRFFHAVETDPNKVSLYAQETAFAPVVGCAESISAWVSDTGDVLPKGTVSISEYVMQFAPAIMAPDGFISSSLIPCEIAFQDGEYTRPFSGDCIYYGGTQSIPTDGTFNSPDSLSATDLKPIAGTGSFSIWANLVNTGGIDTVNFGFRVIPSDTEAAGKYSRIYADVAYDFSLLNNTLGNASLNYGYPFNSGPNESTGPLAPGTRRNIGIASNGGIENNEYQIFNDIDDLNANPQFIASFPGSFAGAYNIYFHVRGVAIYGASVLKFGSSYAIVVPGSSPWWVGAVNPQVAARNLLEQTGAATTLAIPSYLPQAAQWGEFIEPETTFQDASVALCKEFWLTLGAYGVLGADGTGQGELIGAPTFALSAIEDIATEISIKYKLWAGDYLATAYITHVDEEFDEANPSRYFGGWGNDGTQEFGRTIWNACRNAWKSHGIKRAISLESPGVHDDYILGRMWTATRNGVMRCEWLAYQSRFMSFQVRNGSPTWSAGSTVLVPQTMASFQGYNLSAYTTDPVLVTAHRYDMEAMVSTYEVALPPITSTGTTDRIVQTLDAVDRIVQTLNPANDRIVQILEA